MRTAQEVIDWIEANTPEPGSPGVGNSTPLQKALWWVAYRTAQGMHECNSVRDWAEYLIDGIQPIATIEDIQSHIDSEYLDPQDAREEDLLDDLKEFFQCS